MENKLHFRHDSTVENAELKQVPSTLEALDSQGFLANLGQKLRRLGIESKGIQPIPAEERTDSQYHKLFFFWFTANVNILSFSAGALAPVFGLGLRDACLVILFFNLVCTAFPAYLSTWGPKLGLRQMVQARYSFGFYGVMLPCVMNLIGITGFCILNCILGGQTLSSVTDGRLSWTVGIVVTAVISLLLSFCGYRVLGWYEKVAWLPVLIVFLVALGVNGSHLSSPEIVESPTAASVLSFGASIAGFVMSWSGMASDFATYFHPKVPSWRIFAYTYFGLLLPTVTLQCLGVACTITASSIPTWEEGLINGNVGGLVEVMLRPTGNFGKFLTVLLALSVTGNIAVSMYAFCLNFQVFVPVLAALPRYVFSLVATAIVIPLAIVGSHRFNNTLANFLGLLGYWSGAFAAIMTTEHLIFRRHNPDNYNIEDWNSPPRLPIGAAALFAGLVAFAMAVICMDQVWFVGPVAKTTGDIGFEVAVVAAGLLYGAMRVLEVRKCVIQACAWVA